MATKRKKTTRFNPRNLNGGVWRKAANGDPIGNKLTLDFYKKTTGKADRKE